MAWRTIVKDPSHFGAKQRIKMLRNIDSSRKYRIIESKIFIPMYGYDNGYAIQVED